MLARCFRATSVLLILVASGGALLPQAPTLHFQVDASAFGVTTLGCSLSGPGDVNGDGHGNVIIAAEAAERAWQPFRSH